MSNIITFPRRRPDALAEAITSIAKGEVTEGSRLVKAEHRRITAAPLASKPSDALEASLDNYRSTMLELAHRRQAFELQMMLETQTAQIKLEAAGYKALVAGVPESTIYGLGEDMAEALSSAMNTVAGA